MENEEIGTPIPPDSIVSLFRRFFFVILYLEYGFALESVVGLVAWEIFHGRLSKWKR